MIDYRNTIDPSCGRPIQIRELKRNVDSPAE